MFQNQVYQKQPIGRAGTLSRDLPAVHTPHIVEGHDLKAGGFAFAGTDGKVKGTAVAGTAPVGFVIFDRYQANLTGDNSMTINEGEEVAVYEAGFMFAQTGDAAVGDKVLVDPTTGKISTGSAAGSATAGSLNFVTVADAETWKAENAGTLTLNVDGADKQYTGLDFSSAESLTAVAAVIAAKTTSDAGCAVNSEGTGLVFTSKTTGASSAVKYVGGSISELLGVGTSGNVVEVAGGNATVDTGFVVYTASDVNGVAEIKK